MSLPGLQSPPGFSRRNLYVAAIVIVLGYLFYFTRGGLSFYFDNDDMYSIYLGWSKPWSELLLGALTFWSTSFRPFGLLVYRSLFELFGFDPLPFRIVCFALALWNVWISSRLLRQLTGSEMMTAFGTLLFAYHARLMEMWIRTAVIYDILCFTFIYTALSLYVEVRKSGRFPGVLRSAGILLLYLLAIDSKEMAVAFPVFLLAYELLFEKVSWKLGRYWIIAVTGLMAAGLMWSKSHGGPSTMNDPSFTPSYTLERFEHNGNGHLRHIFLLNQDITGHWPVYVFAALLFVAALLRSRVLVFAWVLLFFGILPVIFIPPRGGYVLYIAYFGWVLYAATLLGMMVNLATRSWPGYRTPAAIVLFLLIGWRFGKANLHDLRLDKTKAWLNESPAQVRDFAAQMRALHSRFQPGTRILLLQDAFQTDEWTPVFVGRLIYNDRFLTVDRMKMLDVKPQDWKDYEYVFDYVDGRYVERKGK